MKRTAKPMNWLEKLYVGGIVAVFGLIVLHAPISVYFGTLFPHDVLIIKAWKEIVMSVLLVMAAACITMRHEWRRFRRDPLIIASLVLAVIYIVSMQYGHGFKPYAAGLLIDLRYILFAVLAYVAVRLFPESRRLLLRAGLIGACVVIGFGLLQFVLPRDFLSVLGYSATTITPYTTIDAYQGLPRLQSTLRGPNPLGAYAMIVVLVAGAMALQKNLERRRRIWLGVLAVAAVPVLFASYSRSAYIGLIVGVIVAALIVVGKRRLMTKQVIVGAVAVVIIVASGFLALRGTTFYASVFRHEVAGSGPSINSDEGHSQSLRQGIAAVLTHPFGYGTGSTGSASLLSNTGYIVENQYLYVAHEAGWLALVVFLFILFVLLRRAYQRRADPVALGVFASGIGLLIVGMLLPVFADDTVGIVWFGLAAIVAASNHYPGKGNHGQSVTK